MTMATRPQIERLSKRIECLAAAHEPWRVAVILVAAHETDEAAVERHYQECPEDRHASQTIFVKFVSPARRSDPHEGEAA
jgi:hypothetical protein